MVKDIIVIASGKGGVGKSTISVNLATSLSKKKFKIGLLDADIYGPSIPKMLGIKNKPSVSKDKKILPYDKFGIKSMSMRLDRAGAPMHHQLKPANQAGSPARQQGSQQSS